MDFFSKELLGSWSQNLWITPQGHPGTKSQGKNVQQCCNLSHETKKTSSYFSIMMVVKKKDPYNSENFHPHITG